MTNEHSPGTCVRQGPTNPDQCAKCRYLAGPGPDVEPLVIVNEGKKGGPNRVDCLTFRAAGTIDQTSAGKKNAG